MSKIGNFSLDEYYLWGKKTETRYPWERQYLNCEFLEYERKRIEKVSEWYKKFRKADDRKMDSISLYTVPSKLSASWKTAIVNHGDYKHVGLSALFNSPQLLLNGLIPYNTKVPQDYRLIELTESKKIHLVNERLEKIEPVLIIEEWAPLPSDHIYMDVDYEKRIISKIFRENLGGESQISLSLQSPISSAPYDGSIGGISLSSRSTSSPFAKELLKITQLMVPPEYRELNPPKKVYNGKNFRNRRGSKFHLAERPILDKNILSSLYATKYSSVESKKLERRKFRGEFSLISTLKSYEGHRMGTLKVMLKKYMHSEITIPTPLEELLEADIYLKSLKNEINEDLWIQIVYSRQCMPVIDPKDEKKLIKTYNLLKKDFGVLLSDTIVHDSSREHLIRSLFLDRGMSNLKRIAQSIARAEEEEKVDKKHLRTTRNLIIANFKEFIEIPEMHKVISSLEKKRSKAGPRFSIIQTELINHPKSTLQEIFESVKSEGIFKDMDDLQRFLDWLHRKGYVISDGSNRYQWV
ncbi:MAG: hypothetical protein U9N35_04065 [Euryarchaeota archaeon]|nr:hypothetical protein [Euryarchaeota archaeon]